MRVLIERTEEKKKLEFKGTVVSLLLKLDINPETVLVVKDGELLTGDILVGGEDELKILSVVSGG